MLIDLIEKARKQPLAVRQQLVVVVTLVFAMALTLIWAIGYYITSDIFRPHPIQGVPAPSVQEAASSTPE